MTTAGRDRPPVCVHCGAAATVCPGCVRAIALQWFGAVARHPETRTDCQLCQRGPASYCGSCFITETVRYRNLLLQAGTRIGEPAGWR